MFVKTQNVYKIILKFTITYNCQVHLGLINFSEIQHSLPLFYATNSGTQEKQYSRKELTEYQCKATTTAHPLLVQTYQTFRLHIYISKTKKTKLCGLGPRANYTDRVIAACRRS
jgi:hypothetical protein